MLYFGEILSSFTLLLTCIPRVVELTWQYVECLFMFTLFGASNFPGAENLSYALRFQCSYCHSRCIHNPLNICLWDGISFGTCCV